MRAAISGFSRGTFFAQSLGMSHDDVDSSPAGAAPKLLDRVREAIRVRHYSRRTEESYVGWIRRFILSHGKRHPSTMGEREVVAFLSHLAVRGQVAASTQNQALHALVFLYREVLRVEVGSLEAVVRARAPSRLPVVLSREEIRAVLAQLSGTPWLIVVLLYGAGLRLRECLELRVKDVDFVRRQIAVRQGKGGKDRVVPLPLMVEDRLRTHLAEVQRVHEDDRRHGYGRVVLPDALARKYPNAAGEWAWQFVFPAGRVCQDAAWGGPTRFHLHESAVRRAVSVAVRQARLTKRASCHTFRPFICDASARGRV
jgi:integron integrase